MDYLTFIVRKCAVFWAFYANYYDNKNMHKFSNRVCASIQKCEFAQKLF